MVAKLKSSFEFIIPERAAHEARKHPGVEVLDEAPHQPEGNPQSEEAERPSTNDIQQYSGFSYLPPN